MNKETDHREIYSVDKITETISTNLRERNDIIIEIYEKDREYMPEVKVTSIDEKLVLRQAISIFRDNNEIKMFLGNGTAFKQRHYTFQKIGETYKLDTLIQLNNDYDNDAKELRILSDKAKQTVLNITWYDKLITSLQKRKASDVYLDYITFYNVTGDKRYLEKADEVLQFNENEYISTFWSSVLGLFKSGKRSSRK